MNTQQIAVEYTKAMLTDNNAAIKYFGNKLVDATPDAFISAHTAYEAIRAVQELDNEWLKEIAEDIGIGLTRNEHGTPMNALVLIECLDANKKKIGDITIHESEFYLEEIVKKAPDSDNWRETQYRSALEELKDIAKHGKVEFENAKAISAFSLNDYGSVEKKLEIESEELSM